MRNPVVITIDDGILSIRKSRKMHSERLRNDIQNAIFHVSRSEVVDRMAARTANVIARVEPEVKEKAEKILKGMGIPSSVAINMFYRQIITDNGLPFQPSKNVSAAKALNEMTREEFDARMTEGLRQADNGEVSSVDDVRKRIMGELDGLISG